MAQVLRTPFVFNATTRGRGRNEFYKKSYCTTYYVLRSTDKTTMKGYSDYKTDISMRVPIGFLQKIDEFQERYKQKNRSAALVQLLEIGLFIESKLGLSETWTSQDMQEIKEQLETGQLVDWVAKMDHKRFNTLMNIFREEDKARHKPQGKSS
jgi:hypothetical protein